MSDPRQTLSHGTLTGLISKKVGVGGLFPRTTMTALDQPKQVPSGNFYVEEDQSPKYEGELVIYYNKEFGVTVAEPYVAVNINGTLEWKQVTLVNIKVLPEL